MATLISVHNSEGCVGRCDAKCYDAREPDCDCICGGRNHGAGLNRAVEQTREMAETWIERWKRDNPGRKDWAFELPPLQPDLFGGQQ